MQPHRLLVEFRLLAPRARVCGLPLRALDHAVERFRTQMRVAPAAFRDGTTHVIFEPLDFIARLAALVPKPRAHLTRFHGVFAPNSALRTRVVPKRNADLRPIAAHKTAAERHRAMTWAQRLKRVFAIDIETYRRCGARMRVIASIQELALSERILHHRGRDYDFIHPAHRSRAPPQGRLPI